MDIPGFNPAGPAWLPAARVQYAPVRVSAPAGERTAGGHGQQTRYVRPRALSLAEQWWQYSRGCAAALRAGRMPPPAIVYGPVLEPGETAVLNTDIGYSRYCQTSAEYSSAPWMVLGRPAVMLGALAVQGAINHHRKVTAQRQAAAQWRWHQTTSVIVTTDRLLCSTAEGLQSFWFGDCTQFYPDLAQSTLTLDFESTYPVRLAGVAAPALCLWSGHGVLGDAWVDDPRLAALIL